MWITKFYYFSIHYNVDIHEFSTDILSIRMSTVDGGVRDDIRSTSIAVEVIVHHQHISPICECVLMIIFREDIMEWLSY